MEEEEEEGAMRVDRRREAILANAASANAPLPEEWRSAVDKASGRPYYHKKHRVPLVASAATRGAALTAALAALPRRRRLAAAVAAARRVSFIIIRCSPCDAA